MNPPAHWPTWSYEFFGPRPTLKRSGPLREFNGRRISIGSSKFHVSQQLGDLVLEMRSYDISVKNISQWLAIPMSTVSNILPCIVRTNSHQI